MGLWLAVIFGGMLGACTRFAVDRWCIAHFGTGLPYGTFIVNQLGAAILGFLSGILVTEALNAGTIWPTISAFVGMGFCGALTTFSGWAAQILDLGRTGRVTTASIYAIGSVGLGLLLASLAFSLGTVVAG